MARKIILKKYNSRKLEWLYDARWFIMMLILAFVLFRFVIGFSVVSGDSMAPSYLDGEVVMFLRIKTGIEVGDVVAVRVPSGDYYIKRVVAGPGDVVDIRKDSLFVNGSAEAFDALEGSTKKEKGTVFYPYTVSPGNYFILGDNREISVDSRYFGEVTRREVKGKIISSVLRVEKTGDEKVR